MRCETDHHWGVITAESRLKARSAVISLLFPNMKLMQPDTSNFIIQLVLVVIKKKKISETNVHFNLSQ